MPFTHSYNRRFSVNASHLSDAGYPHLHEAFKLLRNSTHEGLPFDALFKALQNVHGHTFGIDVDIQYSQFGILSDGWIVDDYDLSEIVNQWQDKNLSVHADFQIPAKRHTYYRATTENMAHILLNKIFTALAKNFHEHEVPRDFAVKVTIRETPDVFASAYRETKEYENKDKP